VIAYSDGSPADAHPIDITMCRMEWLTWLQRLDKFHTMFSNDLSQVCTGPSQF